MSKRRRILGLVVAIVLARSVLACGPHFPQGYVWNGSGEAMLDWPRTSFRIELSRYVGLPIPEGGVSSAKWEEDTLPKDLEELEAVLFEAGEDVATVLEVSEDYARLRQNFYRRPGPQHETPATPYSTPELDAYLPAEFAMYAEGARLFHGRDYVGATAAWDALLALAPEERCHRSVWAAYMLGKVWLKRDGEIAPRYFEQAIALAEEGYEDSLGLAGASHMMIAPMNEATKNYTGAIQHYLDHIKRCDANERGETVGALYGVCSSMFGDENLDLSSIEDVECLNVMAMWVNSRQRSWDEQRWLEALRKVTPSKEIHGAERIACTAYYAGDIPMAEAWLEFADKKDPHGQWLRAKLLARKGKMREAEAILASLTEVFPADYAWEEHGYYGDSIEPKRMVQGELGVCRLNMGAYTGALAAFLRGGYDEDAAYVADRVMTTNELTKFVKRVSDEPWMEAQSDRWIWRDYLSQGQTLEHLLGRRLVRQGSLKQAENFLPKIVPDRERYETDDGLEKGAGLRSVVRRLNECLRDSNDRNRSLENRGESLMEAAALTRKWGFDLYGTAHAPDMAVMNGSFEFSVEPRMKSAWTSDDERRRVAASAPVPDRRFHYRWRAADLLWKASKLLPDNDERTARALWEGGRLIANRDPGGADKFYKALVNRCRKLPIGQEADRLRWFPPRPSEWRDPKWAGKLAFE